MKITICGSMAFAKEMIDVKNKLEENGHAVFIPDGTNDYISGQLDKNKLSHSEDAKRKMANDLIRKHYDLISDSNAILVLNYEKKGIKNYIGGNSFLEIGFAHILRKKIFLMNEIPEIELMKQEIEAMQPQIIKGDLDLIS
jgi:hypothetical protein